MIQNETRPSEPPVLTGVTLLTQSRRWRAIPAVWLWSVTTAVVLGYIVLVLSVPLPKSVVGIMTVVSAVLLLLSGVPIAFAMLIPGIISLLVLGGFRALAATLTESPFLSVASWQLVVLPLFVLMGIAMWRSGLTSHVYAAARQWLGKLPGGLAIGTNFAGAGLASASGSTIGISYALGRIAIPEMMRAKYDKGIATGVVAMAGTLGQLIPPSIILVIYAGIAQVPVGPLLITAVIPGILTALAFAIVIFIRVSFKPSLAPRGDLSDVTWATRLQSISGVLPVLVIVAIVIGGLFSGLFTPTEAGAVGALAAIVMGLLFGSKENRGLRGAWHFLRDSMLETVKATAAIFLLIIGVNVLTRVMSMSQLASDLTGLVVDAGLGRVEMLLLLIVVYLILGMFLDPLAMMLLTVPVLTGPLAAVGVDMLWFGVFLVMLAEIAIVTPPVGMLSFIVHRLSQSPEVNLGERISLVDVFKGVLWFVAAALVVLVLLVLFPDIALWLPGISSA